MKIILIMSIILLMLGCENDSPLNTSEDLIIGEWSKLEIVDSLTILTKMRSLTGNEYGIKFNSDGTLSEIKNAGWCGTPPIAYGEFDGRWEFLNDSIIEINTTFWGGDLQLEWSIISLDEHQISYYVLKTEAIYKED